MTIIAEIRTKILIYKLKELFCIPFVSFRFQYNNSNPFNYQLMMLLQMEKHCKLIVYKNV